MTFEELNAIVDGIARPFNERLQEANLKILELETRIAAIAGGTNGKDGRDGVDGKDGAAGPRGEQGERGEPGEIGHPGIDGDRGERGEAGAQGPAGRDGKTITAAEVMALVEEVSERHFERFALDFERRAQDRFQRALDNMPKPKDGRDALNFEDMSIDHDGDGNVAFTFKRDQFDKTFFLRFPRQRYQGVFKEGAEYQEGDTVTFAGSQFSALKDAPEGKPELSKDWQLCVKRGRDGKDGVMKPEHQPNGLKL